MVDVLARPERGGAWRLLRRVRTSASGEFSLPVRPTTHTTFALRFAGGSELLGVPRSAGVTVRVAARVTARLQLVSPVRSNALRSGGTARLTGTVTPGKPGQLVTLQVQVGKGWRNVRSMRLDRRSGYSFALPTGRRGTSRFRVHRAADANNAVGVSPVHVLTVV
jgi:hypothetical protein